MFGCIIFKLFCSPINKFFFFRIFYTFIKHCKYCFTFYRSQCIIQCNYQFSIIITGIRLVCFYLYTSCYSCRYCTGYRCILI